MSNLVILCQTVLEIYDCLTLWRTKDDDTGVRRSSHKGKTPYGVFPKTESPSQQTSYHPLPMTHCNNNYRITRPSNGWVRQNTPLPSWKCVIHLKSHLLLDNVKQQTFQWYVETCPRWGHVNFVEYASSNFHLSSANCLGEIWPTPVWLMISAAAGMWPPDHEQSKHVTIRVDVFWLQQHSWWLELALTVSNNYLLQVKFNFLLSLLIYKIATIWWQ